MLGVDVEGNPAGTGTVMRKPTRPLGRYDPYHPAWDGQAWEPPLHPGALARTARLPWGRRTQGKQSGQPLANRERDRNSDPITIQEPSSSRPQKLHEPLRQLESLPDGRHTKLPGAANGALASDGRTAFLQRYLLYLLAGRLLATFEAIYFSS